MNLKVIDGGDTSRQEREMIEIIRENASTEQFRLSIERKDGAWEIGLRCR